MRRLPFKETICIADNMSSVTVFLDNVQRNREGERVDGIRTDIMGYSAQ